jgi:hypothetical protein
MPQKVRQLLPKQVWQGLRYPQFEMWILRKWKTLADSQTQVKNTHIFVLSSKTELKQHLRIKTKQILNYAPRKENLF